MASAFVVGNAFGFVLGRLIMRMLVIVAVALLGACGAVPVELEAANAVQRQAAEAIEDDYQKLVNESTLEIERMGLVILDAEMERRWDAAATNGQIALADAKGIAAALVVERDAIRKAREDQRAKLRDSPNLAVLKEMNQALRDYLVSVGGATREIERILGIAKKGGSP